MINLFPEEKTEKTTTKLDYQKALELSDFAIFSKDINLIDSTSSQRTINKIYIYQISNGKILKENTPKSINKSKKLLKDFQKITFLSKKKLWKNISPSDSVQLFLTKNNKLKNNNSNLFYQHIENSPLK